MTALTLVKRIRARPSLVFDAMTTADGVSHWWGPDDGPVLLAQVDPRLGGEFRVRVRRREGSEHESHGRFLKFDPPDGFAMSWRWVGGAEDPKESRIDVALRATPEGTEVTFTHSRLDSEASRRSHQGGWDGALRKLELYCAGHASSGGQRTG